MPDQWRTYLKNRGAVRAVIIAFTGGVVLTLLSLMRVEHFPWPDFVHWKYGFPLLWLTHQTSSIAGPVDEWFLDPGALLVDLLLWIALTSLIYAVYRQRSSPRRPTDL